MDVYFVEMLTVSTTHESGNRNALPIYHFLRYFEQSGKCCPHGFYEPEGKYFNEEVFINSHTPITAAERYGGILYDAL